MKRIIAILLTIFVMVGCLSVTAMAAPASDANITAYTSKDEATIGEEVTFSIILTNTHLTEDGIWNYECYVDVGSGLTVENVEASAATGFDTIKIQTDRDPIRSFSQGAKDEGYKSEQSAVIFNITCTVNSEAVIGEDVTVTVNAGGKFTEYIDGELVTTNFAGGFDSVTIICNHVADANGWYSNDTDHWHVCSECGEKFDTDEHTHKPISDTATCGADGVKTYECSVCGHSYTEESKATNAHDYKLISDTATCGKDGKKTYECSVCKHTYEEDSKATGNHDHKLISDTATCGKDGKKTYECSACGDTYEEESKATGKHSYGDWKVTKAATCTTDGSKERVCSVCGHKETAVIDKAGAHTWDSGKVTKEPTCTEEGVKTYTCTKCGATKTEAIKATGHKISTEWATDKDNHWHECSVCGEKIDVEKHSFEWIVDKKATASETGLKHEECATCHYKRNVGTVIPKVEGLDDVPQTGDITPHITFGAAALIGLLGAVAYVFKRKAAK